MRKTDLEVMLEMNQNDTKNGTQTLGMCYDWRNANKVKGGAVIEMAMPENELYKIMNHERIPVLVLIDKKEFFKIKEQSK